MGGKNKAPKPPDPNAVASAQTGTNVGTAVANQTLGFVNQITPDGTLSYDQTGTKSWTDPISGKVYDLPQYTATTTLSPGQQKLSDEQLRGNTNLATLGADQSAKLGSILGKPVDLKGAPDVSAPNFSRVGGGPNLRDSFGGSGAITQTYGTDFSKDRKRVEDALLHRINPQLEKDRAGITSQLANQGIKQGTEAYDRAIQNWGQQANDARYGAILSGGQEQSRLTGLEADRARFQNSAQQQGYDQNLGRATFANGANQQEFQNQIARAGFNNQWIQTGFGNDQSQRSNYLNEAYANRNQPINEIAALLGTGQVQNPNFVNAPTTQMPTVDYAGLVNNNYNQRMNAYQQNQAGSNSLLGGLFGLGSSAIMASDERLKENIEPVGAEVEGNPVYEYNYKADPSTRHIGVMAQDVQKTRPDAVVKMGKFLGVDYGKLVA